MYPPRSAVELLPPAEPTLVSARDHTPVFYAPAKEQIKNQPDRRQEQQHCHPCQRFERIAVFADHHPYHRNYREHVCARQSPIDPR